MFADPYSLISNCTERDFTPYIGGDFNARLGDLNLLSKSWKYMSNVDINTNKHGRSYMTDICKENNVFPINHLKYKNKIMDGDFTYIKNDKKSQIDFAITNTNGRKFIKKFEIINHDWHFSDHRPICLSIDIDCTVSSFSLLSRAKDLNYEYTPDTPTIHRFNKCYNIESIDDYIEHHKDVLIYDIHSALYDNNVNSAISKFNDFSYDMHRKCRIPKPKISTIQNNMNITLMNDANHKFKVYCEKIKIGNMDEITNSLSTYQKARKLLTNKILLEENGKWKNAIKDKNSKELWSRIDWKGNFNNKIKIQPSKTEPILKTNIQIMTRWKRPK